MIILTENLKNIKYTVYELIIYKYAKIYKLTLILSDLILKHDNAFLKSKQTTITVSTFLKDGKG